MARRGVPKGFTHNWAYKGHWKEKKVGKGKWKIDFRATKGRKSKKYGGFNKGTKVRWKINGYQTAVKTSRGTYQTRLRGTKRLVSIKVPKRRR